MSLTQESLWKERVVGLELKKIFERKFESEPGKATAYFYELCFMTHSSDKKDQFNVEIGNNSTVSTMMQLSKLKFLDCELLGLIKNSLKVSETRHQSSQLDFTSPCIEIRSDIISNTIEIIYFITEASNNFQIRFEIVTKSEMKIDGIEKQNVKIEVHKSSFLRNWRAVGGELCNFLEMGFKIGSMDNSCPTMLVFIQYLNYPTFIIFIKSENDILFLKQTVGKTLEKFNYQVVNVDDIRLIFNTKILANDKLLKDLFPDFKAVQCAMVTRKPSLPSPVVQRTPPETQTEIDTNHRYNSILILYRNVAACNRSAEAFLSAKERLRFNEPVIRFTGVVYSRDLGELAIMISTELKKLSENYLMLSHFMIKDENLVQGSTRYDNFKQLLQNTFDAARYAGALLRGFSNLRIPLYQPRPRVISVIRR